MRVYILTGSRLGTAAIVLPTLCQTDGIEIAGVVLNRCIPTKQQARREMARKFRKVVAIGPLGALNGIRMRRWYASAAIRLQARPIDEQARELGIPIIEVQNLKDQSLAPFVTSLGCQLGLSLGNGYIPKSVFTLTPLGMINVQPRSAPRLPWCAERPMAALRGLLDHWLHNSQNRCWD